MGSGCQSVPGQGCSHRATPGTGSCSSKSAALTRLWLDLRTLFKRWGLGCSPRPGACPSLRGEGVEQVSHRTISRVCSPLGRVVGVGGRPVCSALCVTRAVSGQGCQGQGPHPALPPPTCLAGSACAGRGRRHTAPCGEAGPPQGGVGRPTSWKTCRAPWQRSVGPPHPGFSFLITGLGGGGALRWAAPGCVSL